MTDPGEELDVDLGSPSLPSWLGVRFHPAATGCARAVMDPRPEALNLRGAVHGGSLATLADVAMAVAVTSRAPDHLTPITASLQVHYLEPGNGRLQADAQTLRVGRSSAVAQVQVQDAAGRCTCVATGTFSLVPRRSQSSEVPLR